MKVQNAYQKKIDKVSMPYKYIRPTENQIVLRPLEEERTTFNRVQ